VAELDKTMAEERAESAARIKAAQEESAKKAALIHEAARIGCNQYADAVNRNDVVGASKAYQNILAMMIAPIATPEQARERAEYDCRRIAAFRERAEEAGNRGDYASMVALIDKVEDEIKKMRRND
jgi:Na+-translocating ferredoxin:NAD+ oxidoreductase RNF subunit RnfB